MKRGIQQKIAHLVGMSQSQFNQYLTGRRRMTWANAKKIATALDLSPVSVIEALPEELYVILEDAYNEQIKTA